MPTIVGRDGSKLVLYYPGLELQRAKMEDLQKMEHGYCSEHIHIFLREGVKESDISKDGFDDWFFYFRNADGTYAEISENVLESLFPNIKIDNLTSNVIRIDKFLLPVTAPARYKRRVSDLLIKTNHINTTTPYSNTDLTSTDIYFNTMVKDRANEDNSENLMNAVLSLQKVGQNRAKEEENDVQEGGDFFDFSESENDESKNTKKLNQKEMDIKRRESNPEPKHKKQVTSDSEPEPEKKTPQKRKVEEQDSDVEVISREQAMSNAKPKKNRADNDNHEDEVRVKKQEPSENPKRKIPKPQEYESSQDDAPQERKAPKPPQNKRPRSPSCSPEPTRPQVERKKPAKVQKNQESSGEEEEEKPAKKQSQQRAPEKKQSHAKTNERKPSGKDYIDDETVESADEDVPAKKGIVLSHGTYVTNAHSIVKKTPEVEETMKEAAKAKIAMAPKKTKPKVEENSGDEGICIDTKYLSGGDVSSKKTTMKMSEKTKEKSKSNGDEEENEEEQTSGKSKDSIYNSKGKLTAQHKREETVKYIKKVSRQRKEKIEKSGSVPSFFHGMKPDAMMETTKMLVPFILKYMNNWRRASFCVDPWPKDATTEDIKGNPHFQAFAKFFAEAYPNECDAL
jgi:hypothetical protein